jgi:hypothetical protein
MAKLAFTTFAVTKKPFGDPLVLGFERLVPAVFREAEKALGYVDRARGVDDSDSISDADRDWGAWGKMVAPSFYDGGFEADSETRASTLSIWESIEAVHQFAYTATLHKRALAQREKWFRVPDWPSYAMWWIGDDHVPTWAEAAERLEYLYEHGSTATAFTFEALFDSAKQPYKTASILASHKHCGTKELGVGDLDG